MQKVGYMAQMVNKKKNVYLLFILLLVIAKTNKPCIAYNNLFVHFKNFPNRERINKKINLKSRLIIIEKPLIMLKVWL